MPSDETPDGELLYQILAALRHPTRETVMQTLSREQALTMLQWAAETDDPAKAHEMLQVLRRMGGIDLIRGLLSDHA